jgi:hypothetical protein
MPSGEDEEIIERDENFTFGHRTGNGAKPSAGLSF